VEIAEKIELGHLADKDDLVAAFFFGEAQVAADLAGGNEDGFIGKGRDDGLSALRKSHGYYSIAAFLGGLG